MLPARRRPLRILLVGPSLRITGGQAVQAARLLDELRTLPNLVVDFQPINPVLPGPFRTLQRVKYLRTLLTEAAYVTSLVVRVPRYDIVHLFSAGYWSFLLAPAPAILLSRVLGRKTVLNYRDGQAEDHLTRWPLAVRIMRLVDRIVPPSNFLVGVFSKFGLRSSHIFNIIDTSKFEYRQRVQVRPRFFHNRGMEAHYNIPCTLRAFAIIQQRYPDATLTLAHDGPLRIELEKLVTKFNLRNVHFVGIVDQQRMRELYDEADIYLMSPDIDNMPGSILECYASGLPFVSTAAGGVPFIVDNERTGLLVPINDHHAMAASALRLIEEPGLATYLASEGRKECDRYSGREVAKQWAELYSELAEEY